MAAVNTNRGSLALPSAVSSEILQTVQNESKVMRLARQITLPGTGATIPVLTGDPVANWVGETERKTVADPTIATKTMQGYKLAVIVPFSNEFKRDLETLYNAIVNRLPAALGLEFDKTVFGGKTAPGSNFDTMASCTSVAFTNKTAYAQMCEIKKNIGEKNFALNGIVLSPAGEAIFLNAVDGNSRPLFLNSATEGALGKIVGADTYVTPAALNGTVKGVAGDWNQAIYGMVEGIKIDFSEQATLGSGDSAINLWQQNMFAVRAEMEVGFRANLDAFNLISVTA
jgi:HK97 family phage major capsid protein